MIRLEELPGKVVKNATGMILTIKMVSIINNAVYISATVHGPTFWLWKFLHNDHLENGWEILDDTPFAPPAPSQTPSRED